MSIRKVVSVEQAEWRLAPPPAWVQGAEPDWDFVPPEGYAIDFPLLHEQHDVATQSFSFRSIRRLLTHAAVQALGQVEIDFDPAAHRLLIHEVAIWRKNASGVRGKRSIGNRESFFLRQREQQLEQQMLNGRLSVVALLEDVRVGDAIEIAWTTEPHEPMPNLRFTTFYGFAWTVPVARAIVVFHLDPQSPVTTVLHAPADAKRPVEESMPERAIWKMERPPIFQPEPNAPGGHWAFPMLEASAWSSWGEVADFVADLWADALAEGADAVAAEAARLRMQGDTNATVRAVIRFVQEEVRYLAVDLGHGAGMLPNGAGVVLRRRFGDCKDKSVLLSALLRTLGFDACPMLVAPNWRHAVARLRPSTSVFSHAIVTFVADGVRCFIDPTYVGQCGDLTHLAPPPYGCGLEVRAGATGLLNLPDPPIAELVVTETFQLDRKQKTGTVEQKLWARGPMADDLRATLVRQGKSAFFKARAEALQKLFPALAPSEEQAVIVDDAAKNIIELRVQHRLPTWGKPADAPPQMFSYGAHGLFLAVENIEGPEQRRLPWMLRHPMRVHHRVIVRGPSVRTVRGEKFKKEGPGFHYTCDVSSRRHEATFDYRWQTTQREIRPGQFKDYCEARGQAFERAGANVATPSFFGPSRRANVIGLGIAGVVICLGIIGAALDSNKANHPPRVTKDDAQRLAQEFRAAHEMTQRGQYAAAEPIIEKLLPYYRDSFDFHVVRSDIAVQNGRLERARDSAAVARKLDPANALNDLIDASVSEKAGNLRAASESLRKVLLRSANDPRALFGYARVTQQLGDTAGALQAWEAFLSAQPAHPEALLQYALLLWYSGHRDRADAAITGPIRAQPTPSAPHQHALAQYYLGTGRPAEAIEPLRLAMQVDPRNPGYAGAYAMALLRVGKNDEALAAAKQAHQAFPMHPAALHALAVTAADAGDAASARTAFADWLRAEPRNPDAHANYAFFLHRAGKSAEALTVLEKATREFSTAGLVWLNYAVVLEATGRQDEAGRARARADQLVSPAQRATIIR